jgi:hypothetical protein
MKNILEISIPTYNRITQLEKCLKSILKAIKKISQKNRKLVGLSISDNSTKLFLEKKKLIDAYKKKFNSLKINYFRYEVSGYNIGSVKNIAKLISKSSSDYTWLLPDDDLAREDSVLILLEVISKYKPSFVNGGWVKPSKIGYLDDKLKNDDYLPNKVYAVLNGKDKINTFLTRNPVRAQEYVYKTSRIKNFFKKKSNLKLLDEMCPAIYAIYSMLDKAPLILLSSSIGIFRHDEPDQYSDWRHLWFKLVLQDWPELSKKIYKLNWINHKQLNQSIGIFRNLLFTAYPYRPDILLGINKKYEISFFKLFYFHKFYYFLAVLKSLIFVVIEICKRLFSKKY